MNKTVYIHQLDRNHKTKEKSKKKKQDVIVKDKKYDPQIQINCHDKLMVLLISYVTNSDQHKNDYIF